MAIGRTNAGGGGLNFTVVKNPQPATPNENTIWVNTDVRIPRWFFGSVAPWDLIPLTLGKLVYQAGSFGAIDGRDYVKSNSERAVASFFYQLNDYTVPIVLSESREAVIFTLSDVPSYSITIQQVEYNGMVYYYAAEAGMPGNHLSSVPSAIPNANTGPEAAELLAKAYYEYIQKYDDIIEPGFVWFVTSESAPIVFNALKKNGIHVGLSSARQYNGRIMVDVDAMIYQNGAWIDL